MAPSPNARMAVPVWFRRTWKLDNNPFPTTGIARLGGSDRRENGLLYDRRVSPDKVAEATEKFVLGAAYSGLRFGFLWSMGTGAGDSDARGYGKSVLMQHLVWSLNEDFGRAAYLSCGLGEEDADEAPICGLLTSFDTAQIRSLGAALFTAVEYATDFRNTADDPTLVQRLRARLVARAGSDDPAVLARLVADEHRAPPRPHARAAGREAHRRAVRAGSPGGSRPARRRHLDDADAERRRVPRDLPPVRGRGRDEARAAVLRPARRPRQHHHGKGEA